MTTTLSGIAEQLERRIEAFHDGLPQGQGETGDGGKAGKELCQWVYDNAETLATLIRTADDREKVLREALQAYLDDCSNEECSFCKRARQALGGTNA